MKQLSLATFFTMVILNAVAQPVNNPIDSLNRDTIIPTAQPVPTEIQPTPEKTKQASTKIYNFNPWVDIPLTVATGGWSGFAFTKIYSKPASTLAEIEALDKKNVPGIDRWAAGMSSDNADANSNYLFYGSIPVPFALFLDRNIRKDAAKISFMYLEAMSITGLFYTGTVFLVDRYRPETYDTSIPAEDRTSGNYKDAFLAGHPALVATSLFFTAKVYNDYHPESNLKYVMYGVAIAGTGLTAYYRHIAGKHFPTDLLTGVTLGTACGILVPHFHKKKDLKNPNMSFLPYFNEKAKGISFAYRF